MTESLRVLLVEDEPADAELVVRELRRAGLSFDARRVESEAALLESLESFAPDVVLADFTLPSLDGLDVLAIVRERAPATPVLIVTGTIDEETALTCLRGGAVDYLLKDRLGRLGEAVRAALSNRAREEERRLLAAAVEQVDEVVFVTDSDGRILWVNAAFEQVTGWRREQAVGESPRILRSGRHDASLYEQMWTTIRSGETWRGRLVNRQRDGGLFEVDATISPLRDRAGEIRHYVSVQRDVTRETSLQRELEQARRVEALGRMAGGIAHDFNNLLGIIRGYAELLLKYPGAEADRAASLEEVIRAADRGARLTSQLLAYGRRQLLRPQAVDLCEALVSMEEMLRRLLGEGIALSVSVPGPTWVKVDPSRFEQVVMNLVANARDAMPAGGRLTIEAVRPGGEPAPVTLRFSDTGEGMAPEVLAHLFEPFFTTKKAGKGTGLGLATVYGIVVQSGGSISVESAPGAGTTFEVRLPAAPPSEVPPEDSGPAPKSNGRETVLVVEDQDVLRGVVARALGESGYRVLEAADASAAFALAVRQAGVDLVLSDVVLPGESGCALVARLRQRLGPLRALYMSGEGANALAAHGIGPGEARVIQKPFRLEDLGRAVREALDAPP